jgi:glycosyltransferase involved in cell wall biosynthesis
MPTISAVLIVRNEARNIDACLSALKPVADEIVVMDTGSDDGTMAQARNFTEAVYSMTWGDDFAAARNAAIGHATGDWVLSIDADEVVRAPEEARRQLLDFIQFQPAGTTGTIQHVSPTTHGVERTTVSGHVERFFPRDGFRFEGSIHEQVVSDGGVKTTASTGVIVDHSGYDQSVADPAHKARRNIPLLEKAVAAHPEDEYYHYQLGRAHYTVLNYAAAIPALEKALALIAFAPDQPPTGAQGPVSREVLTNAIVSLAYAYANTNRLADAEALLGTHIELAHAGTQWADFYHVCGYVALMLGDIERAKAGYTEAMRCGSIREDVAGTGSYASAYHLGLLAEAEKDLIAAIRSYGQSLEFKPDYTPTLDRFVDFMVENEFGVAPDIQRWADPDAFGRVCLAKMKARLDRGEMKEADFIHTTIGLLGATNKAFAGDLPEKAAALRRQYGVG